MKYRLGYIDSMRGIAILLVVMGHIIQFNGGSFNNPLFEWIYSFHMPLFFFISGFIYQKVTCIETSALLGKYTLKKIKTIVVPFILWEIILNNYLFRETYQTLTYQDIIDSLNSPILWFLKDLFFVIIIYGVYNYIVNKFRSTASYILAIGCLAALSGLVIALSLCGKSFLIWTYSFYFGCIISQHQKLLNFATNNVLYGFCLVLFTIISPHWVFGGDSIQDIYKVVISSLVFVIAINMALKVSLPTRMSKELQKFGKYSMPIYILQFHFTRLTIPPPIFYR